MRTHTHTPQDSHSEYAQNSEYHHFQSYTQAGLFNISNIPISPSCINQNTEFQNMSFYIQNSVNILPDDRLPLCM